MSRELQEFIDPNTGFPTQLSAIGGQSSSSSTGGSSTYCSASMSNTLTQIKSGAASLYSVSFYNPGTSIAYVQFFDLLSANITLGTTAPKMIFVIPAGSNGEEKFCNEAKIAFLTGLSFAVTSTPTGNGAPQSAMIGTIAFK